MGDGLLYPGAPAELREDTAWVHVIHRVNEARNNVVPWLDSFSPMKGARVLEIGAGTGSSVLAMAEAGASVLGIDILEDHLALARERLRVHKVEAELQTRNAVAIGELPGRFDLILYSATVEHMTYEERLSSLSTAWDMLESGGVLGVYETPNRLWYSDGHTSLLNYFHWLPDELAMSYAKLSPRAGFNAETLTQESLARWGRGASYHEFELALPLATAEIGESYHEYLCRVHPPYRAAWEASEGKRYYDLLGRISPDLPGIWREEILGFMLRKP